MPTEQELKTLLAELQEKHPLKDNAPVPLLFGGWGFASTDIKDRSIVIPRSWLRNDAWCYFALLHEYAHLLSQDQASKLQRGFRLISNFLAHDKLFKSTEFALMAEYGISFKRMLIYPSEVRTPWGSASIAEHSTIHETFMNAIGCNAWGFGIAAIIKYIGPANPPDFVWYFLIALVFIPYVDSHASSVHQSYLRWRNRKHRVRRGA